MFYALYQPLELKATHYFPKRSENSGMVKNSAERNALLKQETKHLKILFSW